MFAVGRGVTSPWLVLAALLVACGPPEGEVGQADEAATAEGSPSAPGKTDDPSSLPEVAHWPYVEGSTALHYLTTDEVRLRQAPMGAILNTSTLGRQGDAFMPTGRTEIADDYLWAEGDLDTPRGEIRGWLATDFLAQAKTEVETNGPRTVVINLVDNRAYFMRDGTLQRAWNVGSGRNQDDDRTPSGRFTVHDKDPCPPFYGSDVVLDGCHEDNPLGPKALWFYGGYLYGLHGTTAPELLDDDTAAASRRVSGGCLRNVNDDIEWLFVRVQVGDEVLVDYLDAEAIFGDGLPTASP